MTLEACKKAIKPPCARSMQEAHAYFSSIAIPLGSLGLLQDAIIQLAGIQRCAHPSITQRTVVVFWADNGVVAQGVTQCGQEVTALVAENLNRSQTSVCRMAARTGVQVLPVDIGVARDVTGEHILRRKIAYGTQDMTKGPAMSREDCIRAIEVGIEMAEYCYKRGDRLVAVGEMGIGNTTSTSAIASAFLGLDPQLTVGRGSGINDERMKIKRQVVIDGLAKNMPKQGDAMDILCKVGGYDHAGLAGVIIGAARRRVPTMVDGVNATAAALLAYGLYPQCRDYMLCSHLSSDISHKKMLELMQLSPIVDAGMRLGEGTGASLAIVVLQAAMDVYNHLSR